MRGSVRKPACRIPSCGKYGKDISFWELLCYYFFSGCEKGEPCRCVRDMAFLKYVRRNEDKNECKNFRRSKVYRGG